LHIAGMDELGDPRQFVTLLPVGEGGSGAEKIASTGLEYSLMDEDVVIDNAAFDSPAQAAGLEFDQTILKVQVPTVQPWKELMFIPALLLLVLIIYLQQGRAARQSSDAATPQTA